MRTFDRATYVKATADWDAGKFGWQWQHIRRIAAERGFLYPPTGTRHDDRESPEPSQRAVIWRALEERPVDLERIVRRSRSWSEVVDGIFGMESRLRSEVGEAERDAQWEQEHDPTRDQPMSTVAGMFDRVAASLGYVRKASR